MEWRTLCLVVRSSVSVVLFIFNLSNWWKLTCVSTDFDNVLVYSITKLKYNGTTSITMEEAERSFKTAQAKKAKTSVAGMREP